MSAATPLVFRPSLVHRALAVLLCLGSWLAGIRVIVLLVQHFPRIQASILQAKTQGEPTWSLWAVLIAGLLACLVGGLLLLAALVAMLMIEGSQVLVDELGIAVEHGALPTPIARRVGAGRLSWKQIVSLEKKRFLFVIRGEKSEGESQQCHQRILPEPILRFLVVDELERLIFLIFERSPNLRPPG